MFKQTKRGQAVLEYIIILAALVGAFFAARGLIQTKTQGGLEHVSQKMQEAVQKIEIVK